MNTQQITDLNQWLEDAEGEAHVLFGTNSDAPFVRRLLEILREDGTAPNTIASLKDKLERYRQGDAEAHGQLLDLMHSRTWKRIKGPLTDTPIKPLRGNAGFLVALAMGDYIPDDLEIAGEVEPNLKQLILDAAVLHACGVDSTANLEKLFDLINTEDSKENPNG
jgi:hypothetical protein